MTIETRGAIRFLSDAIVGLWNGERFTILRVVCPPGGQFWPAWRPNLRGCPRAADRDGIVSFSDLKARVVSGTFLVETDLDDLPGEAREVVAPLLGAMSEFTQTWPPYDPDKRTTMVLGARCEVVDGPLARELDAWDAVLRPSPD